MVRGFLGVDVGSVSSNLVVLDERLNVMQALYFRTNGDPIGTVKEGIKTLFENIRDLELIGVGTTGSGRYLAGVMLGADTVRNEITAHAVGACHYYPDVKTIFEIGGQDSKLIILRDGIVVDFSMNTVCAAGTGSFLDQQALRLNIPIEEFGELAVRAKRPVRIAGRCGVFAESDMIHKQQMGYPREDIIAGLCEALARNYLNNLGKGKKIEGPVVFQGGVAANKGMKQAFEKLLGLEINVPPYHNVMGAIGAALLSAETTRGKGSLFKGRDYILEGEFLTRSSQCQGCPNQCEVVAIMREGKPLAYWGDRCRRWESSLTKVLVDEAEMMC